MHIIYLCCHYLLYCIYYATASCVHCCVLSLLPTGGCRLTVNSRLVRTYVCTKSYTWFTQSMAQMHSCASVHTTHSHTHVCVCWGISVAIFCTDYSYPMTALCSHLLSLYGVCVLPWHWSSLVSALCSRLGREYVVELAQAQCMVDIECLSCALTVLRI